MITKFNVGQKVSYKLNNISGIINMIAVSPRKDILYEIKFEKPIYNQTEAWYPEDTLTLNPGGSNERSRQT